MEDNPEIESLDPFYNCSECSSQIEILYIDNDNIEFICFNKTNPHKRKMLISEYINKMKMHYIDTNNEKCMKHNKEYVSYCLECNIHLCDMCLISREHLIHDKIYLKEILPNKKELSITLNIIDEYENKKELIYLKNLYEIIYNAYNKANNNYYNCINMNTMIINYIENNPTLKNKLSKDEYDDVIKIKRRKDKTKEIKEANKESQNLINKLLEENKKSEKEILNLKETINNLSQGINIKDNDKSQNKKKILNTNFQNKNMIEEQLEIKFKETMRCQFIKIINEHDNNEAFIHLYQNNNKNPVFSYLLLIKEEENPKTKDNTHIYRYKDSITSHKGSDYESHICLNVIPFEKGTYYLCCDINYRFLRVKENNDISIQDYLIKIISKQKIEVKNETENLRTNNKGNEIFKEAMVHLMVNPGKLKISTIDDYDNGVEVKLFKEKEKLPFDIFYFKSRDPETLKIKFEIDDTKWKNIYYLYNDNEFSELDKLSVKVIEGFQSAVIMVMNNDYSFDNNGIYKKYLRYQIKREIDIEYEHPVFKKGKQLFLDPLKNKVKLFIMKTNDNKGYILGVENICDNELKLILNSDTLFVCNPQYWHYGDSTEFKFSLKKGEKKAICLRNMLGKTDSKFILREDK